MRFLIICFCVGIISGASIKDTDIYTKWNVDSINTCNLSMLQDLECNNLKILESDARYNDKNPYFVYGFDFNFFIDNLEGSYPLWATRTLFRASIFPEIGMEFYNQSIRVGGYYMMDMGERVPSLENSGLSLYYSTATKNFNGFFGIFPRKHWIGDYSSLYYRKDFLLQNPMTNGVALQYKSANNPLGGGGYNRVNC
uniref:Uncharacterized protein n=1 Tax=uncultured Helicobacter sp. TaxID=175537 RepID=A0A650EKN2_9HELI|nr:hypothetical protein Helico6505_0250 [uncultured Helicobacter sp.]